MTMLATEPASSSRVALPHMARWHEAPAILCIPVLWIFASSYSGIDGDARIYMGRALADLDPEGVGRDMMFALDGQSAFSIFRLFAARLVAWLGPGETGLLLAGANILFWFTGMACFASRFVRGRELGVLVVCAAVLPAGYGFYPLMAAREVVAVPRPLSEAFVLLALAALCGGRGLLALILIGVAALIHPIMALPGLAVILLVLGLGDRRWFAAAACLGVAIVAAALLGVPIVARLTTVIDPAWRSLLEDRNPYLFIALWSEQSLAPVSVQAATLLCGGLLCEGRQRVIFLSALGVGLAGVGAAWLFGDLMSLLLVVQIQPWRALWLVSVMAMPALGLCVLRLPRRGPFGQIALAFLVLAWGTYDLLPITVMASAIAVALVLALRVTAPPLSEFSVRASWALVAGAIVLLKCQDITFTLDYVRNLPPLKFDPFGPFWRCGLLPLPFIGLAWAWARWPQRPPEPMIAGAILSCFLTLVILTWDNRTASTKRIETNVHDARLTAMTASKAGSVLWLTSDDEWYWLGRPQWNSFTQGAGMVFSRDLAMGWRDRTTALVTLGLVDPERMRPWRFPAKMIVPELTATALKALCGRADAPAWVVAPLLPGHEPPDGFGAAVWQAPVPQAFNGLVDGRIDWHITDRYAVVPCAGRKASTPLPRVDGANTGL